MRTLLEQLVDLWGDDRRGCAPLLLIFSSLSVTAVLKASDTEVYSLSQLDFISAVLPRQQFDVLFGNGVF